MKTYYIPVTWYMTSVLEIEAENLKQAIEMADEYNLPPDGEYVDDSYEVNIERIRMFNKLEDKEYK